MTEDANISFNFNSKATEAVDNTQEQEIEIYKAIAASSFDDSYSSRTARFESETIIDDGSEFSFDSSTDDGMLF